ncbi:MAG: Trm112 family protein [Candidatus Symbiodolus clandestinus]
MEPRLFESIACPRCYGKLELVTAEAVPTALICLTDQLRFPIENDMPVLLLARAISNIG